jgi:hypothetical protein
MKVQWEIESTAEKQKTEDLALEIKDSALERQKFAELAEEIKVSE